MPSRPDPAPRSTSSCRTMLVRTGRTRCAYAAAPSPSRITRARTRTRKRTSRRQHRITRARTRARTRTAPGRAKRKIAGAPTGAGAKPSSTRSPRPRSTPRSRAPWNRTTPPSRAACNEATCTQQPDGDRTNQQIPHPQLRVIYIKFPPILSPPKGGHLRLLVLSSLQPPPSLGGHRSTIAFGEGADPSSPLHFGPDSVMLRAL